jgi:type VI secretion system secreted protein VgrG
MTALGERMALALRAGGFEEEDLHVLAVEGREALSEPYAFDVTFRPASEEPLDAASFLRAEAVLALRRPTGEERHVHGECVQFRLVEVDAGNPLYRLRIGPKLLRLEHVVRSRVFQEKSIPEIVQEVLAERQIETRVSLAGGGATLPAST